MEKVQDRNKVVVENVKAKKTKDKMKEEMVVHGRKKGLDFFIALKKVEKFLLKLV